MIIMLKVFLDIQVLNGGTDSEDKLRSTVVEALTGFDIVPEQAEADAHLRFKLNMAEGVEWPFQAALPKVHTPYSEVGDCVYKAYNAVVDWLVPQLLERIYERRQPQERIP